MDNLKEKIDYLKLWLSFLVAIDAGSTAWLWQNLNKIIAVRSVMTFLFVIFITITVLIIHKKTYKIIKNVGE
jgi:hypothetical protein